jgi:diguanylate cyclase (GGDEF)-like protein
VTTIGPAWLRGAVSRVRRWGLWQLPVHGRLVILATQAAAAGVLARSVRGPALPLTATALLVILVGLSSALSLVGSRLEGLARLLSSLNARASRAAGVVTGNQLTVWETAAMLILPSPGAVLVVVVLYLRPIARAIHDQTAKPYRSAYSWATLRALRSPALSSPRTALAALAASLVCTLVSLVLITALRWVIARPIKLYVLLPPPAAFRDEATSVGLGLIAGALIAAAPWMSPLVLILVWALSRSVLSHQLQRSVNTDAKTGLLTLRAWQDWAGRQLHRTGRHGRCVVLMIDLDHFKAINDHHGHLIGDEVLYAVAQRLKGQLRDSDLLARFGGEEFTVYLDDTTVERACEISNRLRHSLGAIRSTTGAAITVTASIGIAGHPVHGRDLASLLAAADTAVLAAKSTGRDRYVVAAVPA